MWPLYSNAMLVSVMLEQAMLAAVINRALYDSWLTTPEAAKQAMREARHFLQGSPFYTKWDEGVTNAQT